MHFGVETDALMKLLQEDRNILLPQEGGTKKMNVCCS